MIDDGLETAKLLGLSLKNCSRERNIFFYEANAWRDNRFTTKDAWRAPAGKRFKITGEFMIWQDQSETCQENNPPEASLSLARREFRENEFRKGSFRLAFRHYLDSFEDLFGKNYHPPTSFLGRWLVITPKEIKVRGNLEVEFDQNYMAEIRQIAPEIKSKANFYNGPFGEVVWYQWVAEGKLGDCRVRLVKCQEELPKLSEVEFQNKAIVPVGEQERMTVEEYCDWHNRNYGKYFHLTPEVRLAEIRDARSKYGLHTIDDPLRDIRLPVKPPWVGKLWEATREEEWEIEQITGFSHKSSTKGDIELPRSRRILLADAHGKEIEDLVF